MMLDPESEVTLTGPADRRRLVGLVHEPRIYGVQYDQPFAGCRCGHGTLRAEQIARFVYDHSEQEVRR